MNAVTDDRTDAELAHLAGGVGNDPVIIVEQYSEAPIGEDFLDAAFHRQKFFFGQFYKSKKLNALGRACTLSASQQAKQLEKEGKPPKAAELPVAGDAAGAI